MTFFAPIRLSKPLSTFCLENVSFSFQEPYIKHYRPGIDDRIATSTCGVVFGMFNICVSVQSVNSLSANLSVSWDQCPVLKTLLFFYNFKYELLTPLPVSQNAYINQNALMLTISIEV